MTDPVREALALAKQFIENGIELGYIRLPDPDCPDPAHRTLDIIRAALAQEPAQSITDADASTRKDDGSSSDRAKPHTGSVVNLPSSASVTPPADDLVRTLTLIAQWERDGGNEQNADAIFKAATRIQGYQASRDYAIDLLAKALGIEADKMRAVEFYARETAAAIEALRGEVAEADAEMKRAHAGWEAAELRIEDLRNEREDWARRFKLNDVTPWDWMTRAEAAEARAAAAEAERDRALAAMRRMTQSAIDAARAKGEM